MRLSRVLIAVAALLLAVGLSVGVLTGLARGNRAGLGPEPLATQTPARSATPTPSAASTSPSPPTASLTPVLAPVTAPPKPDPARVSARIAAVDRMGVGNAFSGLVLDAESGTALYQHRAGTALIPASTTKILTAAAALSRLGPEHRFATTVTAPAPGQIVLVGGGDPYLATKSRAGRASIATLADRVAASLKRSGQRRVALRYDASLFSGPAWHPRWPGAYRDQVTRVSALWVDEGRVSGGSPGARVADPPAEAAKAFAAALKRRGVTVTATKRGASPSGAPVIATVESPPLERVVESLLMSSDNDASEVLFRHAALAAGQPGSFDGGRRAVRAELAALGVLAEGVRIDDGSGLSRETRVPATTLARLLRLAMGEERPELRGVVTGLPVAGVEGSLRFRFGDDASRAGRGLVRGKTGTLRRVHTLAGFVRGADGSLLVYAFLVNNAKNEYESLVWLDRVTAALAGCGCRRN